MAKIIFRVNEWLIMLLGKVLKTFSTGKWEGTLLDTSHSCWLANLCLIDRISKDSSLFFLLIGFPSNFYQALSLIFLLLLKPNLISGWTFPLRWIFASKPTLREEGSFIRVHMISHQLSKIQKLIKFSFPFLFLSEKKKRKKKVRYDLHSGHGKKTV